MAEKNALYKCELCGNVVSVIEDGAGTLVCCGQDMNVLEEQSAVKEGREKHVPIIESTENGLRVTVGSIHHPMEEVHYISLIQIMRDGKVIGGKRLHSGEEPIAEFCMVDSEGVTARAFCNIHGLWKSG